MKYTMILLPASLAIGATAAMATALAPRGLSPITVKGNAFFQDQKRFYIRGVDYQPGGSSNPTDPLADSNADACKRDIEHFQELGLNTIRVYTIDNSAGHDTCMNALAAAGIYLILDVNSPKYSLNRKDAASCAMSYNSRYLQNIFATIDAFASYPNTLAFFSGNEVIDDTKATTITAPYIKAVTRDMKQYMAARSYRKIPVGYSGADVESTRYKTAQFLNCGSDDARSDFFAFNDYSWCDPSSFSTSGWDKKVELFSSYSLPLFLSEFGCITHARKFEEVAALYGPQMTSVYSGGLVYEYFNEESNYGLATVDGSGNLVTNADYDALKSANQGTPLPSDDGGYRSNSGAASPCPAADNFWVWGNNSLPALPADAMKYMSSGADKGVGLTGVGSQTGAGSKTGQSTSWSSSSGSSSSGAGSSGSSGSSGSGSSPSMSGTSTPSSLAAAVTLPELSMIPFAAGLAVLISSFVGGSFLLV